MPSELNPAGATLCPFPEPAPPLSKSEHSALLVEAHEAWSQLFTAIRCAQQRSNEATQLGGVSGKTADAVMLCTTTTVFGTLEEIAALYTGDESHFILDFAQTRRIYELESPTPASPMRCTGLRWSRWKTISKLISDRDILYLESMDAFVDEDTGRRGWARCTKSIAHPLCPESQHPDGPVRAQLLVSGMIIQETAKFGVLEMVTLVHIDVKNVPAWIGRAGLKSRQRNAMSLNHVLKVRRRFRENPAVRALYKDAYEDGDPRACKGCHDRVSRWVKTFKCRKCSEMICKLCAAMAYYDNDTKQLKNRLCAECSFDTQEDKPSSEVHTKDAASVFNRGRAYSHLSVDTDDDECATYLHDHLRIGEHDVQGNRKASNLCGPAPTLLRHNSQNKRLATHKENQHRSPRSGLGNRHQSTATVATSVLDLSYLQTFAKPKE